MREQDGGIVRVPTAWALLAWRIKQPEVSLAEKYEAAQTLADKILAASDREVSNDS